MGVELKLNGTDFIIESKPVTRLSDVLREECGDKTVKVGCNAGDCGSCSVLIDGEVACSCLTSVAQVQNCEVTTLSGLNTSPTIEKLQKSFLRFGAAQCGICTPGMLVSAAALLDKNPEPSRQEVMDGLGGVLCRCTGYSKIVDAILSLNSDDSTQIKPPSGQGVGAAIQHLDGIPKVVGSLSYGADTVPENAVYVRVVRSPHHYARFTIKNKDQFLSKNPDIVAVLDASDVPGINCFGVIPQFEDQPVFAEDIARYRGEAVMALIGAQDAINAIADADIPIEWEPLDFALEPSGAKDTNFPHIHRGRDNNLLVRGYVEKGNVAQGLDVATHTVSVETSTPYVEHAYIELEAGYCVRRGNRLELYGCTQAAMLDRYSLAKIMGLDENAIRIMPSACGGGFGAKLDLSFQPYLAIAAWLLDRPAFISYSRSESMAATTKRHPSEIKLTVGCSDDGIITGFDFVGTFNTGAYSSWGPTVANRVPVHGSGPYYMANYKAVGDAVHTNGPPSGAFRGFGVPQSAIAQETAFDQLADKASIDRLEFRLRNALQNGLPTATGQVFEKGVGITECLETLKPHWERANKDAEAFNKNSNGSKQRKGVGIASCWYGCGNTSLPNPSTIRLGIKPDGTVVLHQGAMDIGQGANTVITQIAADAFGVPVHDIELIDGDTDLTPDCGKTSASRQTYVTGKAAQLSGMALRRTIFRNANVSESANFKILDGKIVLTDDSTEVSVDLSNLEINEFGYVLMAEETYDPPTTPLDENGQGTPYAVFGYGAQLVELTVDTGLGKVKLDKITTAHDVGRAINPLLVEGQIEGGVAQGIGLALMEEYIPGRTENLHDYLIPTFGDMPEFEHHIVEVEDGEGPYGAKGLGEHVLIPTAPAILNAIRHATGAIVSHLPATPDKVLAAIDVANGVGG